ncbi:transglycosylase SLT domain-containing protein [Streptomyces triculaminicus]|uniref:transglycosylase SLT domain-containing protein n=1 Tax=Streptomyces triculaminicus TaxID=2816232 RepID=UPI00340647FB
MDLKRGLILVVAAIALSPLALGLGIVLLIASIGGDKKGGGNFSLGGLKVGKDGVPPQYAGMIQAAADSCPEGLPAAVLAAQLEAESNFKPGAQSKDENGNPIASGIAQFIPETWAEMAVDGNGDGKKDVWDPADAIPTQGKMMCDLLKDAKKHPDYNGSPIELALAGYNAGFQRVIEYKGVPPRSFAGGQTYDYVKSIMANVEKFSGSSGGGGGSFTDGQQTWTLNNPRSVDAAIAWAKAHSGEGSSGEWYNMCLAFTAVVYGWNVSGVNYAIDHYDVVPKGMQHPGDRNPPPGALMYWDTGSRAGHIAVYIGNGQIVSNDILRKGYIDVVDADQIEKKWGAKYVGWTPPVFPHAG